MADGWTAGTRTSRHRAPGQIVFEGTIPAPAAAAAKKKGKKETRGWMRRSRGNKKKITHHCHDEIKRITGYWTG